MFKFKIPQTDDRGETLIETLISIVLLGIIGLALLDGTIALTKSSVLYDRQASAFNNQRSWAEEISNDFSLCTASMSKSFSSSDSGTGACVETSAGSDVYRATISVTSNFGGKYFTTEPLDVLVIDE